MKMLSIASALLLAATLFSCTETDITPARTAERTTTTPATSYTAGSETPGTVAVDTDTDAPTTATPAPTKPVPAPVKPITPVVVENP